MLIDTTQMLYILSAYHEKYTGSFRGITFPIQLLDFFRTNKIDFISLKILYENELNQTLRRPIKDSMIIPRFLKTQ